MLRPRFFFAAVLLFLAQAPVSSACVLHVRASGPTSIAWDAVDGIDMYQVEESFDNFATSRNYFLRTNSFNITRRTSVDTKVKYIVTAVVSSSILSIAPAADTCTESLSFTIPGDPQFRALTAKAILPITGSIAGAFGSRFKTSLKLTASGPDERGRIVFHPAGAAASANDPSMRYALGNGGPDTMQFDDVVAQLGASGVGSLDIIPDDDVSAARVVPNIEARLYNDTPSGTFGTAGEVTYPFDFLQAPTVTVTVPDVPFRMNLGVRTLTATSAKALVYDIAGRLRTFTDLAWPADFTTFGTVQQVIGTSVAPGEKVVVFFDGSAIPFYTVTENRTNDPQLFVVRPEHSNNVASYVE